MADYIKQLHTKDGPKQIDYTALANLPQIDSTLQQGSSNAVQSKAVYEAITAISDEVNTVKEDVSEQLTKLDGISEGANKVEASLVNGNILIDGEEINVYKQNILKQQLNSDGFVTGYAMSNAITTNGINLTYKTDYGATMPSGAGDGRLFFILDDTADRIIRFGLDNGWYYQKFESGIVKCWRSVERTIETNEWQDGKGGSIGFTILGQTVGISSAALTYDIQYEYPSSSIFTFIERPTEIVSISNDTSWSPLTFMGRNHSSVTLSTTKLYNIITKKPEQALTVTMEFLVIGRWK